MRGAFHVQRKKYNALEKLSILEEVSNGETGFLVAAKKYGINKMTLMKWQRQYKMYGYEGLERRTHLQSYSAELKLRAMKDLAYWWVIVCLYMDKLSVFR